MIKAYIGLGSNLGVPQSQLRKAIIAMEMIPSTSVARTSSFYSSKPIGPEDQPDYVNAVVALDTELSPSVLLTYLQAIENEQGRQRKIRWGARTLDLDILLFGDEMINDGELQVPHAEMSVRGFVLLPLHEISPDCIIPKIGMVGDLLAQISTDDLIKLT